MKSKLKDVRIYELEVEVRTLKERISELEGLLKESEYGEDL